jgi:hypothetical protein
MSDLRIPKVIIQIFQTCVAVGILGILNGFALYSGKYYTDLVINNEIPFASKLKKYVRGNSVRVGICIGLVITFVFFVIFGLIGSLAFINVSHYSLTYGDVHVCNLYSFIDVICN